MDELMQCPVCGFYTLTDPFYDICPVCFWEDDGIQADQPNVWGGANGPSLITARINYREYGACDEGAVRFCRPPKETEKHGKPYKFAQYYYDGEKRILYRKNKHLFVEADRYGTPFDDPVDRGNEKYRLISERIAANNENSDKWREILENSVRQFNEPWRNDKTFDGLDENMLMDAVWKNCHSRHARMAPNIRKLRFGEYVKKLADKDFKDGILQLKDEDLLRFESACGCSVFEVLEMEDDACAEIYKKICDAAEKEECYKDLPELLNDGWADFRWDVPEWMETFG